MQDSLPNNAVHPEHVADLVNFHPEIRARHLWMRGTTLHTLTEWMNVVLHTLKQTDSCCLFALSLMYRFLLCLPIEKDPVLIQKQRNALQLYGITCIFMASKLDNGKNHCLLEECVIVTHHEYSRTRMIKTEQFIMQILDYHLLHPGVISSVMDEEECARNLILCNNVINPH